MHDKELRACAVRVHCSCHRKYAGGMLQVIFEACHAKFACDMIAGAAHAAALGVAALDHEAGDHAVEDGAVVKTLFHQGDEVVHRVGGDFGIKLSLDDAAVLHFKCYDRIHTISSFLNLSYLYFNKKASAVQVPLRLFSLLPQCYLNQLRTVENTERKAAVA